MSHRVGRQCEEVIFKSPAGPLLPADAQPVGMLSPLASTDTVLPYLLTPGCCLSLSWLPHQSSLDGDHRPNRVARVALRRGGYGRVRATKTSAINCADTDPREQIHEQPQKKISGSVAIHHAVPHTTTGGRSHAGRDRLPGKLADSRQRRFGLRSGGLRVATVMAARAMKPRKSPPPGLEGDTASSLCGRKKRKYAVVAYAVHLVGPKQESRLARCVPFVVGHQTEESVAAI